MKCSEKSVNDGHCINNATNILVKNQAEVLLLPDEAAALLPEAEDELELADDPPEDEFPPRKSVTYHPVPFN